MFPDSMLSPSKKSLPKAGHATPVLSPLTPLRIESLPKGSNVVPFWVCYGFWVRDYNILPKKELHRRVWVGFWV